MNTAARKKTAAIATEPEGISLSKLFIIYFAFNDCTVKTLLRLAHARDMCRDGDLKFQLTLCRQRDEEDAILEEMKKKKMLSTRLDLTASKLL